MLVDVEIELQDRRDMGKPTRHCWSKLFQGQLQEGDSYRSLHKAVTVNMLDFDYPSTERYHTTRRFTCAKT